MFTLKVLDGISF